MSVTEMVVDIVNSLVLGVIMVLVLVGLYMLIRDF